LEIGATPLLQVVQQTASPVGCRRLIRLLDWVEVLGLQQVISPLHRTRVGVVLVQAVETVPFRSGDLHFKVTNFLQTEIKAEVKRQLHQDQIMAQAVGVVWVPVVETELAFLAVLVEAGILIH
jgi:hypothetical protein